MPPWRSLWRCRSPAAVPLVQRWETDPLTLCARHGVLPLSLLLHVALVACVTAQVVLINDTTTAFSQRLHDGWIHWLFPEDAGDFVGNPVTFPGDEYFVYRASQVDDALATLVGAYFSRFTSTEPDADTAVDAVDAFVPGDVRDGGLSPPTLAYTFAAGGSGSAVLRAADDYDAWLASVNGSDPAGWASFVQSLSALSASAQLRSYNPGKAASASRTCALWDLTLHFDLSARGVARVWLEDAFDTCVHGWSAPSPLLALAVAIVALAAARQIDVIMSARATWAVLRDVNAVAQAAAVAGLRRHGRRASTRRGGDAPARVYGRALLRCVRCGSGGGSGTDNALSAWELAAADAEAADDAAAAAAAGGARGLADGANSAAVGSLSMAQASALAREATSDAVRVGGGGGARGAALADGPQSAPPLRPPTSRRASAAGALGTPVPLPAAPARPAAAPTAPPSLPLPDAARRALLAGARVRPRAVLASLASPWPLVSTAANALNVAYAVWALVLGEGAVPANGRLLLAVAAALDWVSLLQYFKFDGNYYLLGRTLSLSAPMMAWNVLGALPLYLAFATAACVLFGGVNERFDGLPRTAIALFAIANGDVVRETFAVAFAYEPSWLWGAVSQAFMYVFCATFIYAILKTTTAINEQSYLLVRPLPPGAKPGARASAIPNARGKPDSAPRAFALPDDTREALVALQLVRDAGGTVGDVVAAGSRDLL